MSAPRPILIHGSGGDHRGLGPSERAASPARSRLTCPGHPDGERRCDRPRRPRPRGGARPCEHVAAPAGAGGPLAGRRGGPRGGAHARPELVDGLVGDLERRPPAGARQRRWRACATTSRAERERLVAGFVADPTAPRGPAPPREAIDACGPAALAADYAACRSVDLRGGLGGVRVPGAGGRRRRRPAHPAVAVARSSRRELPMAPDGGDPRRPAHADGRRPRRRSRPASPPTWPASS